uniref:F-box domain-containing protein n=1 Tax=Leersia perrieri TaxID=77586 RepID=A0A0D9WLV0_9ORYZ
MEAAMEAPWTNLPSELLGLVLSRLPSFTDRVRLRVVCGAWRSAARQELSRLPPPLPWIVLRDGTFVALPEGAVHRVPFPGDVTKLLPAGRDVILTHNDGTLSLMDPFSSPSAVTPLPYLAAALRREIELGLHTARDMWSVSLIDKVVVSEQFTAFLINSREVIIACGPLRQQRAVAKWRPPKFCYIIDIALFQGKLYALTDGRDYKLPFGLDEQNISDKHRDELHILGVSDEQHHMVTVSNVKCIHSTPRDEDEDDYNAFNRKYVIQRYLVASADRLFMIRRWVNWLPRRPRHMTYVWRTCQFEVFEAVDLNGSHGQWIKVDTLMGHSLFVSKRCSNVHTTGAEEDCIYFIHENYHNRMPVDPFLDSGMYNMRDGMVAPLLSETATAEPLAGHDGPFTRRPLCWLINTSKLDG